VLDVAIAGLPEQVAVGHHAGDAPDLVARAVKVRSDSAAGRTFALACRSRNVGFAVMARSNEQIHAAISRVAYESAAWAPAIHQDGQPAARLGEADINLRVGPTNFRH
jgi:hypothetical protein